MLPKIILPTHKVEVNLPREKIKNIYSVRPMTVREEKILLMAKQAEKREDQVNAVKQIVNNCVQTPKFDIMKLPYYEMEYLFLKIRSLSISNKAKATYRDNEDDKEHSVEIDLDKVELQEGKKEIDRTISLPNDISFTINYPSVALLTSPGFYDLEPDAMFSKILMGCIDTIYEGEKAYPTKNVPEEELKTFVDSIPSKEYEKIQQVFDNTPHLYHKVEYTNSKGTKREIELKTLEDFFMF